MHGGYLELVPLGVGRTVAVELIPVVTAAHLFAYGLKVADFCLLGLQFFIEAPLPKLEALEVLEELLELRLPNRQGFVALHCASGLFSRQHFVLLHSSKSSHFVADLRKNRRFASNLVLAARPSLHRLQELSRFLDLARCLPLLNFLLFSGARGAALPFAPDVFVILNRVVLGSTSLLIL